MGLAAALRLYQLGAENFWLDEIFSLEQATYPLDSFHRYWNIGNRPLRNVFIHYLVDFGNSEFLLRLPYAILGVANVALLFLLSRELVERRVALRASLFLAILPLHVWYSQEVRWYVQWALLATLAFLALIRLWRTRRTGWWVVYTLSLLLALYTFIVSIHLTIVQAISAWLLPDRGERRRFLGKVALTTVAAAIVAMPFVLIVLGIGRSGSGGMGVVGTPRATSIVVLPYLFFSYVAGYTIGPTVAELHDLPSPTSLLTTYPEILLYFAFFGPIAALALWSLRTRRACAAVLVPWVVGLPLLVFATAVLIDQTLNVRYTFAAVPGFALLLSLGVESLGRWRRTGTLAAVGLFTASLINYYANPRYDKEQLREATQYIRTSSIRNEPVAVVGQGLVPAIYYGEELEFGQLIGCGGILEIQNDRAPTVHLRELRAGPAFWLLVSRDWAHSGDPCLEDLITTHEVARRREFTGVEVYLLERGR